MRRSFNLVLSYLGIFIFIMTTFIPTLILIISVPLSVRHSFQPNKDLSSGTQSNIPPRPFSDRFIFLSDTTNHSVTSSKLWQIPVPRLFSNCSTQHPVTWIQRKSHRFGQSAHVDWGKIEQDPAGLVLTLKTWALYSVRCPGRRPLCLLCFPQDEPPEYHFPWRFFWSFHMMFSGSKVCPPELHINRTIRHCTIG